MSLNQFAGMGGHHSNRAATTIWLTPPAIIEALGGPDQIDLDPCAPFRSPVRTARRAYSYVFQDGLALPWHGRVFLNPPYSHSVIGAWLAAMAGHGRGTALIFARTDTEAFHDHVAGAATALLFLRGRLNFHRLDGRRAPKNAGAPSVLCAYGQDDAEILAGAGLQGAFVPLRLPRSYVVAALDPTWRAALVDWMRGRAGPVLLADLYRAFTGHPKTRSNPTFRATIRRTLQEGPFRRAARGQWEVACP